MLKTARIRRQGSLVRFAFFTLLVAFNTNPRQQQEKLMMSLLSLRQMLQEYQDQDADRLNVETVRDPKKRNEERRSLRFVVFFFPFSFLFFSLLTCCSFFSLSLSQKSKKLKGF